MDDEIVPGHPDYAAAAASLIAATDTDLFRYYGGGDPSIWVEAAEHEWRGESGIYSHTMSHVARLNGELVGLLISYPSQRDNLIDWTLGCSRAHLAPDRWGKIATARPLAAFLFPVIPKEAYYVQNVVTGPKARGRGLGRRFMELAFAQGRAAGCRSCHLDVDSSTPAVHFYKHLGMRVVVRTEVFGIPGVHAHYRMVIDL